ncbi:putative tail fiber protein [Acinetobacter phage BS46]|nr:putative tail fiber protein [Acinetobacter phage BS46]
MTDLRIADAPELALETITGNEKIPTGGYGNNSVTISNIGQFVKTALTLATEAYVSNVFSQTENKIILTGNNLIPSSNYVEIPQINNIVLNSIHQNLLNRMEWIKNNVSVITDHQVLLNRSSVNTHPSTSISHNGTSNVSIEIEELKNDVLRINTETIPELQNYIVGKQDVIVSDANLTPVSSLSNVPSTNNISLNSSLQALLNRIEYVRLNNIEKSGTTAQRPAGVTTGYQFFDTTLGKPIYWNGSSWVDSTGASV